jgi:alkanesulfonate monooxygenase SsuD/methylene tetrahydromethanopterin reductase-like flavin-dependent oxidoreductase (luciferase family)
MQIGFSAPTAGPLASLDHLARLCTGAEELGYHYATFSDHVVIPTSIGSTYPYSATGEFTTAGTGERNEQLIELAFVAARTSKLRLVTSVMVVPHRPAVLAAKQLATIDVMSGGRVTLGIGAGWMKEEFEALGVPAFAERGKVTDEYVAAFRELWIWVGGESGPALRRTAKYGDAWYPIGTNPAFPLDSLKRFSAGIERLRKLTREAGREANSVGVVMRFPRFGEDLPAKAGDGERRLFSGKPDAVAGDIKALGALGVDAIDMSFGGATVPEILAEMKRFKSEVMAKV